MPTVVEIPEVGEVEFPDSMSEQQIGAASARLHREATAAGPTKPGLWDRVKTAVRPGLQAMGEALAADPAVNEAAGQTLRDAITGVKVAVQSGLDTMSDGMQRVPGPVSGAAGPDPARAVAHPLTPMVNIPRVGEDPQRGATGQVVGGLANVGAGVAEGLLTPLGVATLGAGALPVTAQRLLAGAFAVEMGRQLPEMAAQAADALEGGPLQRKVETVGNLIANTAMAGLAGRHALKPKAPPTARGAAKPEPVPAPLAAEPLKRPFPSPAEEAAMSKPQPPRPTEEPTPGSAATAGPERPATGNSSVLGSDPNSGMNAASAERLPARLMSPVEYATRIIEAESGLLPDVEVRDPTTGVTRQASVGFLNQNVDPMARSVALQSRRSKAEAALRMQLDAAVSTDQPVNRASSDWAFGGPPPGWVAGVERGVPVYRPRGQMSDRGTVDASPIARPGMGPESMEAGAARPQPGAPDALPAGTTPITGREMPVAVDRVVPGSQDMPGIFGQLERVMQIAGSQTPIRTGRMGSAKRWALGFFKPREETIRLQSSFDLPTAAHEVAHSISASLWRRPAGSVPPSRIWKRMAPPAVHSELHALGTKLYGSRKPSSGYAEEGFAEFVRHWLTTDDAATVAPATAKWFDSTVVKGNAALGAELAKARQMVDVWRGQGDRGRALAMMKPYPGWTAKKLDQLRRTWSVQGQVEQLTPLERIGRYWQERKGTAMTPGQDPYMIASRVRGIAPSVMDRFIHRGPVDIDGNPTGNRGLGDVLGPLLADLPGWQKGLHAVHPSLSNAVQTRIQDFSLYLWARRTLERASHNQETGMSVDDASTLIARLDSPKFQLAADQYRAWWDDVLNYYASAGPANAELVKAVKAGSHDYVPLPRVLDIAGTRPGEAGKQGGGLRRMHGSGRPIYDVMESTVRVAERLIEKAHRDLVANAVLDVSREPGFGFLVEEVPLDRVRQSVPVERVRQQLEEMGVDTTAAAPDALLEWYAEARDPKGVDPVYARRDAAGKVHWYVLAPDVFEVIGGVDNPRVAAGMLAQLAAWGTRTFKMGTTGLRPKFNLVTNPLRDAQNFGLQVQGTANPARMLGAFFASVADMLKASLGMGVVKPSAWWEALHDLGVPMANSLAHDITQTRSALRGAWHGKALQAVTQPINSFRELIGGFETVPREAQMRILASELGWKPGMPLTRDQAVALTVAAKRVTTDFTAGGTHSRNWNLYIPFYNAAIQGTRATGRTLRTAVDKGYAERMGTSQRQALGRIAIGGAFLTTLGLGNWLRNKDKEWYRALPWRERFLFTNIDMDDGTVAQVPRPIDWGNLFMVLPEALADSWYQKDPQTAGAAIEHILTNMNPLGLPAPANAILEQAANRDFFWDRPLVPRGEQDLLPGDQRSEYSSWLAKALGDAFPNHVSPRRADALVRQLGGGAAADLVDALGLGGQMRDREKEPSDLPVIGTLFRRGGTYTAANRHLVDFQNLYAYFAARDRSKQRPLDAREEAFWSRIKDERKRIDMARDIALVTRELAPRQKLFQAAGERARVLMDDAKRLGMTP